MKASLATMVLAATAALASPSPNRHRMFHHQKKTAPAAPVLSERDATSLNELLAPINIPQVNAGSAAIYPGSAGPYVNTITNNYGEDVALVAWNNGQFALNQASPPALTMLIAAGQTASVSMSGGFSGAMTTVHPGTEPAISGMINNTLIEMTTGSYGVVDISREVNMQGTNFTVAGSQCKTDMETCVFTCYDGITCGESQTYQLQNCATGSQPGASYGVYDNNPSGGCMMETQITTTINPSS